MISRILLEEVLLDDEEFQAIVCQDCTRIHRDRECPVCDDPFDPHCWNHHAAKNFVDDILRVCDQFGFTIEEEDNNAR